MREEIPYMSESDGEQMVKEAHLRMVMNAKQAGREIPAQGVSVSQVGYDTARLAVEGTQNSMRSAARRSFTMPEGYSRIFRPIDPLVRERLNVEKNRE